MTKPPGLRIESAASVILEDTMKNYFQTFSHVIRADRVAGQSVSGIAVDTLAACIALIVAGGHGSREEVTKALLKRLDERVTEDLRLFRRGV